jgi:hypothetical protein
MVRCGLWGPGLLLTTRPVSQRAGQELLCSKQNILGVKVSSEGKMPALRWGVIVVIAMCLNMFSGAPVSLGACGRLRAPAVVERSFERSPYRSALT